MISKTKKTSYCFKRWTRKGFAMFSSLHKVVKIGFVTFTCTLVQKEYQPIFAQTDSTMATKDVQLREVEVSANPTLLWSETASAFSVVEKKEIEAGPSHSIEDILEKIPGIDIRQRGSDGVQSDISINGGSFDQVLILLNGVNITDPQTGHHNLNLPVDLSQIQKVEVLQGSASSTLGYNAFSGVINIVTTDYKLKNGLHGQAGINTGSFGYFNGIGSLLFKSDSWLLEGSFSNKLSKGYIENTDYNLINFLINAGFKSRNAGSFQFQAGYQQKDFGANSFYSFSYPNQFEATKTLFASLTWDYSLGKNSFQARIFERSHHDRFELFRNMKNAASWYSGHNYHLTNVTGTNIKISIPGNNYNSIYGLDVRNEHILSNVLGESLLETIPDPFEPDAIFTRKKNRTNYSVFTNQTVHLGKITFSGGLNGNYNSDFGIYLNGVSEIAWNPINKFKTWFGINRSSRLPTFTDLYYKSANQISNPNLLPETALTYESGVSFKNDRLKTSVTLWNRIGKNMIDWIKEPDSVKWKSSNITNVNAYGFNFIIDYKIGNGFFQSISANHSFQNLNKKAEGFDSKYALDYLKNKIIIKLSFKIYESKRFGNLNAAFNSGFYDRSGTWTEFGTNILKPFSKYILCDSRLNWGKNKFNIYLDGNNIFGTEFSDFGGMKQPGISLKTGVKYNF